MRTARPQLPEPTIHGRYVGTRWTRYLRAPNQFMRTQRQCASNLVPLGTIAEVAYNVKSGADEFFYVTDVTDKVLRNMTPEQIRDMWGVPRGRLGSLRVIDTRSGYRTIIEDECLVPVVFNLMGIERLRLSEVDCSRHMVVLDGTKEQLRRATRWAHAYVTWGERQGFHLRPTSRQRVRATPPYRQWYELQPDLSPSLLWSQAWGVRHLVPEKPQGLSANKRMFRVVAVADRDSAILAALLNSTWAAAWKFQFGRFTGQEGYFDTDVIAADQLPVVDPRRLSQDEQRRILAAYDALAQRTIGPMRITEKIAPNGRRTRIGDDEFGQPDRRSLDEAIAEAMGIAPETARAEVDELYADLGEQLEATRAKELLALQGKASGVRRMTNEGVVDAVLASLSQEFRRSLADFLFEGDALRQIHLPEGEVVIGTELPGIGDNPMGSVAVNGVVVDVGGRDQADWVRALSECGIHGPVWIPVDSAICRARLEAFDSWRLAVVRHTGELIAEQTNDPRQAARIQQLVIHQILRPVRAMNRA